MEKSNFRDWTLTEVDTVFKVRQVAKLSTLTEWVSVDKSVSDYEQHYLSDLQESFLMGIGALNEAELASRVISPIFVFAKLNNYNFSYFLERKLSANIASQELTGRVDGMVATGFREPQTPFFCLNEYKREKDPEGDPAGQVLIAMLVAQHQNNDGLPIYGCYVIGRLWVFVVLEGKEYAFSNGFTVDNGGIYHIFNILKGLKVIINQRLGIVLKNKQDNR